MAEKKKAAEPGFVMIYMIPLLLFYFLAYKLQVGTIANDGSQVGDPKSKKSILQIGFAVIVYLIVYGFTVKEMSKNCKVGSKNFGLNSFLYSFVPFIFIFGSLLVAMILFPGWKSPFSNTIGYFIVKNVIARKLFSLQEWVKIPEGEADGLGPLKKFNSKNTKTFFVNELTPENFFNALKSLNIGTSQQFPFHEEKIQGEQGMEKNPKSKGLNITKELYKAVVMKDIVAEFIWLFLGGVITYSVAQIYAIDHRCQASEDDKDGESAIQKRLKQQYASTKAKAEEQVPESSEMGIDQND